jgi:hypothetical protein
MPEVISKHPEITIQVLESAGARCGDGLPQRILTQCPAERFCAAPMGEICVYGLNEIPQMTQISPAEIMQAVAGVPPQAPGFDPGQAATAPVVFGKEAMSAIFAALLIGAGLGVIISRIIKPRQTPKT